MSLFEQNKEFYNRPIRLTLSEQKNPDSIINGFCGAHHLYEIRKYLWDLLETALTTNEGVFQDAESRQAILVFYAHLEELMEAIYLKNDQKVLKRGKIEEKKA